MLTALRAEVYFELDRAHCNPRGKSESRRIGVSGGHSEVFVKIHENGWAVSKPNAERASAVFDTQAEAIERARELAGNGTIHIQGRHGRFRKLTVFEEE